MVALTVADLVELHDEGIRRHGGDATVTQSARDAMGSVLHSASYQDGILAYAASLLYYIARAQHFTDGNKRTGWFACVRALELDGYTIQVDDTVAEEYVRAMVQDADIKVSDVADQLADWLAELAESTQQ